jgi:hypothetical protein
VPRRFENGWLIVVLLAMVAAANAAERIVSRADVERIFAMNRDAWESYAPRIADPKWKIRLQRMETGTGVMAFDPSTGMGLSIQPLYADAESHPAMLIVGSFYPKDQAPPNLAKLEKEFERDAQRDLGAHFKVSARYVSIPPNLVGIELTVTRAEQAAK